MSSPPLRCPSLRRAAAVGAGVTALALAGLGTPPPVPAAIGGGSQLQELAQQETTPTTTTPKTTSTAASTEPTNSHTLIFLALGAAVVLLSGIAFVIVRDARRVAPAGDPDSIERASARDSAARLRRRRMKAKAARQQRKRNR